MQKEQAVLYIHDSERMRFMHRAHSRQKTKLLFFLISQSSFTKYILKMSSKRILYVGGLADEVDEKTLQSAFIPFGETMIQMPLDYSSGLCSISLSLNCICSMTRLDRKAQRLRIRRV